MRSVNSHQWHESLLGTDATQRLDEDLPSDVMGTSGHAAHSESSSMCIFRTPSSSIFLSSHIPPTKVHACILSLISIRFSSTSLVSPVGKIRNFIISFFPDDILELNASSGNQFLFSIVRHDCLLNTDSCSYERRQQYYQRWCLWLGRQVTRLTNDVMGCCARCAAPSLCRTAGSEPHRNGTHESFVSPWVAFQSSPFRYRQVVSSCRKA